MLEKEFICGLEDYKQKTDLFPHTVPEKKSPVRIVRKNKKFPAKSAPKTKE